MLAVVESVMIFYVMLGFMFLGIVIIIIIVNQNIPVQLNVAKEIANYWNESSRNNENKMDII